MYIIDYGNYRIREVIKPLYLLGIDQVQTQQNGITLFPNPNDGKFTIQWSVVSGHPDSYRESMVEIYNVVGERVKSEELKDKSEEIDMSLEPNGVYFYRILSEDRNVIGAGKFVVSH
jgi:hypothetical protein